MWSFLSLLDEAVPAFGVSYENPQGLLADSGSTGMNAEADFHASSKAGFSPIFMPAVRLDF